MKKLRKILPEAIILGISYLVILVVTIVSMCLNEWSTTANGMPVCDRWMFFPTTIFIVFTMRQVGFFIQSRGRVGIDMPVFSILKFVAVFVVEAIIDLILDPVANVFYEGDFAYLILVVLFFIFLLTSFSVEMIAWKRLKK